MGEIIEFYKPVPKVPTKEEFAAQLGEESPTQMPARSVLGLLLEKADTITDVLVLMRDTDGVLGFIGNLEDLGECLLFIERVKHRVMVQDAERQRGPEGAA